jgi:hypothetical protein
MWQRWHPDAISEDFARVAELHANTVRVIVQTPVFGWPQVQPRYAARLARVVQLAADHGLAVELTLFDWWSSYRQVAASKQWAADLLAPYRGDPRVACIELQNELDPRNPRAVRWARTMIPFLRGLAGSIPVTISVGGGNPNGWLSQLRNGVGAATPDFWTIHYYDKPELAYGVFAAAQQTAAPLPLFVGETGYWPGASDPQVRRQSDIEDEQVRFLRIVESAATRLGLPAIAPWILSDFSQKAIPDGAVRKELEYHFGLFRVTGKPKPAAGAVAAFFGAGGVVDPGFDEGFEQPEPGRPTLPSLWRLRGVGAFALDTASVRSGADAMTVGALDGEPTRGAELWGVPPTPWVGAGQTTSVSVWARGDAATGRTTLAIVWYDQARRELARAESPPLAAGTSDWTELTAAGTAPAGAAYFRIVLRSDGDAGRVWFDDVSLTPPAS